jgi:shikimate kinase
MNLVLIGYRGTGKSTVGEIIARRLGWDLKCLDSMIIQRAAMSIPAIVEKFGWDRFRELESEILAEVVAGDRQVLDCGGGIILRPETRDALKKSGKVVWLTAEVETIADRLADKNDRPSLTGGSFIDEISEVLAEREELYREAADVIIATDGKSSKHIADEVLEATGLTPAD